MSNPWSLKKPSSIAAAAGKYEFEIRSGTASFIVSPSTDFHRKSVRRSQKLVADSRMNPRSSRIADSCDRTLLDRGGLAHRVDQRGAHQELLVAPRIGGGRGELVEPRAPRRRILLL